MTKEIRVLTEYTNFCGIFSGLSDLECGAMLLAFGKQLDMLTPTEWHAVGAKVADFRSAVAFQCVTNSAQSVIGARWESINAKIFKEANRYVQQVKDRPEVKDAFCAYRIENIGGGVSGAVGEIIANERLGQMGFPVFFRTMFACDGETTLMHN